MLGEAAAKVVLENAVGAERAADMVSTPCGFVAMPKPVHFLVGELARAKLGTAIQGLKRTVSSRLIGEREQFRQCRHYDCNVWSEAKRIEKLVICTAIRGPRHVRIERAGWKPVKRELVEKPEDWTRSNRHYASGIERIVGIESPQTAMRRARAANALRLRS